MSDLDTLRQRGIKAYCIVDGTGVAVGGSLGLSDILSRGMKPICQVDSEGVDAVTSLTQTELLSLGIRCFCALDESGIDPESSDTQDEIRSRGILGLCPVDASGIALGGSLTVNELAQRGILAFCPVDEDGNETTLSGVHILLSGSHDVDEDATTGTAIGTLSVANGSGDYTFTITSDPDSKFAINVDGVTLELADTLDFETAQSHSVTIEADNGVDDPISRQFTISVINVLEVTLNDLTLDTAEIEEGSAEDMLVGTLQDVSSGSTLSLIDSAGDRFKLSGTDIVAGPVATDFEAASSHDITVRETHGDADNSPHDSIITITVTEIATVSPSLDFSDPDNSQLAPLIPGGI